MDWFLYDNGLHHERVKAFIEVFQELSINNEDIKLIMTIYHFHIPYCYFGQASLLLILVSERIGHCFYKHL